MNLDKKYWKHLYQKNDLSWDIGYASPTIIEFIENEVNKNAKILFPGAGNSHEAQYLFEKGYKNLYVLDIIKLPFENLLKRCPQFPEENIIVEDFFTHKSSYDIIIEQTFFTSFEPEKRAYFAGKIYELLKSDGKYAGLFFNHKFNGDFPPFGAFPHEYKEIFGNKFSFDKFETATNSIKPRKGKEIFFVMKKIN